MASIRRRAGSSPGWLPRRRQDKQGWEGSTMAEAARTDRRTALLGAAAVATGAVAVEVTAVRSAITDGTQGHGVVFRVGGSVEDIAPGDYAPNTAVIIRSAP